MVATSKSSECDRWSELRRGPDPVVCHEHRHRGKAVQDPETGSLGGLQACERNQGAAGVDGRSIAELEANLWATSTSSGTGCRQEATFLRRVTREGRALLWQRLEVQFLRRLDRLGLAELWPYGRGSSETGPIGAVPGGI